MREAVVNKVVVTPIVPTAVRWRLLRALGMDVCASTIGTNVYFGGSDISIGENVWFDAEAPIYISDGVRIGANARILTTRKAGGISGDSAAEPVLIGRGAQIGKDTVVQPGVTIGEGAVIAPNSVVCENCRPNTRYAGNPAAAV